MRNRFFYPLMAIIVLLLVSCGDNQQFQPPVGDPALKFGSPDTFDIVTWNLQFFPLTDNTVGLLAEIMPQMEAEVFALQEIMEPQKLHLLAAKLPHHAAYVYEAVDYQRLGFIYDVNAVSINNAYSIYNGQGRPFPRPPYVLDLNFKGERYYLINNHLKAFGDNYINHNDLWDEEMRRLEACTLLDAYITENLADENVIVLGDMNDQIQEPQETNVFWPFISKPDEYLFTTMNMAQNPSPQNSSYPRYTSTLDHILISNELFEAFENANSYCRAIRVESYVGGLSQYYSEISDHRPVGVRLRVE